MQRKNPKTGKAWTDAEEAAFADIMRVGRMERIKAIQLFKRCKSNPVKALKLAAEYGDMKTVNIARGESLRRSREARLLSRKGAAQGFLARNGARAAGGLIPLGEHV